MGLKGFRFDFLGAVKILVMATSGSVFKTKI